MTSDDYFSLRNIDAGYYTNYKVPSYILSRLSKDSAILDFGCGFGQLLVALKNDGFTHLEGADVDPQAIRHVSSTGIIVHDVREDQHFYENQANSYDFIVLSHVLEHLPKVEIISRLHQIRSLLKPDGQLLAMVPNAQSNTGCYWAYEDFTHTTLFTAGSVYYVLRAAGFSHVDFIDIDCTAGMTPFRKLFKKTLLGLYRYNISFWNKVTGSAFHSPSPRIFSYEIKTVARP